MSKPRAALALVAVFSLTAINAAVVSAETPMALQMATEVSTAGSHQIRLSLQVEHQEGPDENLNPSRYNVTIRYIEVGEQRTDIVDVARRSDGNAVVASRLIQTNGSHFWARLAVDTGDGVEKLDVYYIVKDGRWTEVLPQDFILHVQSYGVPTSDGTQDNNDGPAPQGSRPVDSSALLHVIAL